MSLLRWEINMERAISDVDSKMNSAIYSVTGSFICLLALTLFICKMGLVKTVFGLKDLST